jgi:hypothetical protein
LVEGGDRQIEEGMGGRVLGDIYPTLKVNMTLVRFWSTGDGRLGSK